MKMAKKYRYKGESLTLSEWAARLGTNYNVLQMRIANGWPVAKALTVPVKAKGRRKSKMAKRRTPGHEQPLPPQERKPAEQKATAPASSEGMPIPKRHNVASPDFLRGMAEGIWLTISSVAMMMAESGGDVPGKNLKRMEDMFKGNFAERFASVVAKDKAK